MVGLLEAIDKQAVELALDGDETSRASASMADTAQQEALAAGALTDSVNAFLDSAARIAESAQSTRHDADAALTLSREGAQLAQSAATRMDSLSRTVSQAADTIQVLDQRADKIASMTSVIKDIADQTNLLALNAAIEAARAGEQGRGFAVVADEVRKLAERTTQSTMEISSSIGSVQQESGEVVRRIEQVVERIAAGVQAVENAGQVLGEIEAQSKQAVTAVAGIAVSMREQSGSSQSIADSVETIAAMSEANSQACRDNREHTRQLSQLASDLDGMVSRFKV